MRFRSIVFLCLVFPPAVWAENPIREFVMNEFRYSSGHLICFTDNKSAVDTPCLHMGGLAIGQSKKDAEAAIAAAGGKFYKKIPQKDRPDIYAYSLPTPKSEKNFSYLVLEYLKDKVDVLQLTGTKTDAPLAFSSLHLGDSEVRVLELFGPPDQRRDLTDMAGSEWRYSPYPVSLEIVNGKVYSLRVHSEESPLPAIPVDKGLGQVTEYLTKTEYPEKFGDVGYRIREVDMQAVDFFGDGNTLVFMAFDTHYLQSPTIVLFKVSKGGKVTRVTEGLAPGPLLPLSLDYLDSHVIKEAVDMTVDGPASDVVKAALQQHSYIVRYPKFYHVDNRVGPGGYLDMSDHAEFKDETTCAKFEFSRVESIRIGKVAGGGMGNRLAALVGRKIYLYEIKSISPEGFLEKSLKVIPEPADFKEFNSDPGLVIQYETKAGKTKDLSLPH